MNGPTTSATGPVRLGDLAAALDLELRGDPEIRVGAGATLAAAMPGQISFLANPAYQSQLTATRASAVVLSASAAEGCPCAALVSEEPYAAWARVLRKLHPAPVARPGIHDRAHVDGSADIDPGAEIGPLAHVAAGARVGAGVVIGPGCIVGENAVIDADTRLVGNVFVGAGSSRGGDRCRRIRPGDAPGQLDQRPADRRGDHR